MKFKRTCWVGIFAWMLVLACSRGAAVEKDVLATVNDYKLTVSEFQRQLAADMEIDRELKMTNPIKKIYLNQIIQQQVLIQEAKRQKLDQQPKFIRAIQRYWEATLIRELMESKGQEIEKQVIVSQEEVQRYYDDLKRKDPAIKPLSEMDSELTARIREDKKTAMFQKWVDELKHEAAIHTNDNLLDNM